MYLQVVFCQQIQIGGRVESNLRSAQARIPIGGSAESNLRSTQATLYRRGRRRMLVDEIVVPDVVELRSDHGIEGNVDADDNDNDNES